VKRQKLIKILRQCGSHPTEAAAHLAARFIRDLAPAAWYWPRGTRTIRVKYSDFREQRRDRVLAGELVEGLQVKASQVCEWQLLRRGKLGVVMGNWLIIFPAESAEPLF
jgi:hypothetical protein